MWTYLVEAVSWPGLVVLAAQDTGEILAMMDAKTVTAMRTGAVTGGAGPAARAESPVVLFDGDGSLLMNVQELETIERFDWGNIKTGEQWTTRLTMSDPRVSGVSTGFQNVYAQFFQLGGQPHFFSGIHTGPR